MTQEDKLLLKDLCARLPFEVMVNVNGNDEKVDEINPFEGLITCGFQSFNAEECKPYLRPMSSMTEEEKRHISKMMCLRTYDNGVVHDTTYPVYTPYYVMEDCLSYLRSIHMDYSGMIEKGLALAAPERMYNSKEE